MFMSLLGYKPLDFESGNDHVKGMQLFVSYAEDGVTGHRTDKLFLKDSFVLPELRVGDTLDVSFNHRGKAEKITVAPANQRLNLGK